MFSAVSGTEDAGWLYPSPLRRLDGSEGFTGHASAPFRVGDFWAWAYSDLRANTIRGVLAEFLVARAVGDERPMRVEWDNYDVVAPDGTRIEVKSSAYLQSWPQRRPSSLSFGRISAKEWDEATGAFSAERRVRADVFVFAVQTQRDPAAYDPLDVSHWRFWVVPGGVVRERAGRTVGIGWVRRHGSGPHRYEDLATAIGAAAKQGATASDAGRPAHADDCG